MLGVGGIALVFLALLVLLGAVAVIAVAAYRRRGGMVRENGLVLATRLTGVLGGVVAALVLAGTSFRHGTGTLMAPAAFGLIVVICVGAGEALVRPQRPAHLRTASLQARRLTAYTPRWTGLATLTSLAMLTVTLIFTTATATSSGTGGSRELTCHGSDFFTMRGPYPGSYYSAPLAAVVAVIVLLAALAARQAVRRPRGRLATADDDVLRHRSVTAIVAATGLAVSLTQAAIAASAGGELLNLGTCAPGWASPAATALMISAVLALGIGVWCLVRVLANNDLRQSVAPSIPVEGRWS